jgi:hypothetical protein
VTVLKNGEALTLADILTSDLESYDTLAGAYALFTTLSSDANLAKFAWLLQWPTLKPEEKRAKYSEFACHELSFFLSRKTRTFFAQVIQPYLRNKKDKTFMDEYLIGADLKRYLEPWAYSRLNVVERALLAQRCPAKRRTRAALARVVGIAAAESRGDDRLFETALRGARWSRRRKGRGSVVARSAEVPAGERQAEPLPRSAGTAAAPAAPAPQRMAERCAGA